MKDRASQLLVLAFFLLLACVPQALGASGVLVTVSGNEIWDGVLNPHAADGVTLAGGVYTIPHGMVIESAGAVFLHDPAVGLNVAPSGSVGWDFSAGTAGLTFADATSEINVYTGGRYASPGTFTMTMGNNDILGSGRIINGNGVGGSTGDTNNVVINSLANVTLGVIDLTRVDADGGAIDVITEGAVDIGAMVTADVNGGGDSARDINITGSSLTLGDIDTRTFRDIIRRNGDINLVALAPSAFDVNNAVGNSAADNIISLTGAITSNGPPTTSADGNLNLTAVKVVLDSGFTLDLSESATATINAGLTSINFSEGDLFMDMASSGLSANFTVLHEVVIPEPSGIMLVLCGGLAMVAWSTRRTGRKHKIA